MLLCPTTAVFSFGVSALSPSNLVSVLIPLEFGVLEGLGI